MAPGPGMPAIDSQAEKNCHRQPVHPPRFKIITGSRCTRPASTESAASRAAIGAPLKSNAAEGGGQRPAEPSLPASAGALAGAPAGRAEPKITRPRPGRAELEVVDAGVRSAQPGPDRAVAAGVAEPPPVDGPAWDVKESLTSPGRRA